MPVKQKIFLFSAFACAGTTAEIIFTSIKYNIVIPLIYSEKIDWILDGTSYLWMFFIYGSISFILPPLYRKIKLLNIFLRLIIYAITIFTAEFILGFLLDTITGNCPWLYTNGITISGYIRLDYLPFWMVFAFCMERFYLFLVNLTFKNFIH